MKDLTQSINKLSGRKQRQSAKLNEIFFVVSDNNVTMACYGALILKHILEILGRVVNGSSELPSIHRKNCDKPFKSVKRSIQFLSRMIALGNVGQICKCQQRGKNLYLTSIRSTKYLSCLKSPGAIVEVINQNVGIQEHVFHLPMIYANRSSLFMSSWVTCPMPRNCTNSSGSSGRLSQSIVFPAALAFVMRTRGEVIRRSALTAFSIILSFPTMMFSWWNNSTFNCVVVITLLFLISAANLSIFPETTK